MTTRKPAILLLDLALPKLDEAASVSRLRRLSPGTRILLLTDTPDEEQAIRVLKAGAAGYCDIDSPLLKKAVEKVQDGEIWVGRGVVRHLLEELVSGQRPNRPGNSGGDLEHLTPREREVASVITSGASNKEIGSRLRITERTVKAHLTSIFRKLGLSGRLRLAVLMTEQMRPSG